MTELKRVAIVGSARIPFARGGTAYAEDIDSGDLLAMRIPMEFDGNGQAADR